MLPSFLFYTPSYSWLSQSSKLWGFPFTIRRNILFCFILTLSYKSLLFWFSLRNLGAKRKWKKVAFLSVVFDVLSPNNLKVSSSVAEEGRKVGNIPACLSQDPESHSAPFIPLQEMVFKKKWFLFLFTWCDHWRTGKKNKSGICCMIISWHLNIMHFCSTMVKKRLVYLWHVKFNDLQLFWYLITFF